LDIAVSTHATKAASTVTSPAFSTSSVGDLLVAFVAADGPATGGSQTIKSVVGGGLTWTLAERSDGQPGSAEIWTTKATTALSNTTVTASLGVSGYVADITVAAFSGASGIGARAAANAASGAPTVSTTSTASGSWLWGIGNDWDNGVARTVGSGQVIVDQYVDSQFGNTFWVQHTAAMSGGVGVAESLSDTAPTADRFDMAAVEILPVPSSTGTTAMGAGTVMNVNCANTALASTQKSATSVALTCAPGAQTIQQVGAATTFASGNSTAPTTALPTGATAGNVLVSFIESYPFTTITCRPGWTLAFSVINGTSTRLAACTTVMTASPGSPGASVVPMTQVSMVTMAFSGVSTTLPVDTAAAAPGLSSPAVATTSANDLLVLGEGSNGWRAVGTAPGGATTAATVNDNGNSQVAVATMPAATAGTTKSAAWTISPPNAMVVAGTVALRPSAAAVSFAAAATPGTISAGSTITVTCAGTALTFVQTGRTTGTLTCASGSSIIRSVGAATTFSSSSSESPTTNLPSGASAGNVLVSFVESYPFTTITCGSGWTKSFDAVNGPDTRLAACTKVAGTNEPNPTATVSPSTQVSMVSMAFSGVDTSQPVDVAAASTGLTSPSVTTTAAGDLLVLGEGSDTWQSVAAAPSAATLGGTVNDGGNSQAAIAFAPTPAAGPSSPAGWTTSPGSSAAVAGTVALRPDPPAGAPGPSVSPSTSSTSTSSTVTSNPSVTTSSTTTSSAPPTTAPTVPGGAASSAPSSPPAAVCGNTSLLSGPTSAPSGAVSVPAGNNSGIFGSSLPSSTTYWFAPGVHTLGSGEYSQIIPSNGDTFIGAPGAILDGQGTNDFAFTQQASNVTVEFLTIQHFQSPGSQSVVNHDAGTHWTIAHNTVQNNPIGAGVGIGSGDVVSNNCLTQNGEYGFNAYSPNGVSNVTLDHNEISYNDTYNWEAKQSGCGCSGGGKFWETVGATVSNNYVHDNHNVGLWADTNDVDFNFNGNYISGNYGEGLMYEVSYNATIDNNTFIRNALGAGPSNPGFPTGAIYLSESGGDSRVSGPSTLDISGNVFTDNFDGVVLWENSNRFCNSPDNSSAGTCTLVNPSHVTLSTCVAGTIASSPYYSDCRWKTQNVAVHNNTFTLDTGTCPSNMDCGMNAVFSNYGTDPSWSPYQGTVIEQAITFNQNNRFYDNSYAGAWHILAHDQGTVLSLSQWQAAPYSQDAGSTP
jgi:hypothetical protein